jgi:hypothetical protein
VKVNTHGSCANLETGLFFFEYVLNRTVLLLREADSGDCRDFKIANA